MKVNGLSLGVGVFCFLVMEFLFDIYSLHIDILPIWYLVLPISNGLFGVLNFYTAFNEVKK